MKKYLALLLLALSSTIGIVHAQTPVIGTAGVSSITDTIPKGQAKGYQVTALSTNALQSACATLGAGGTATKFQYGLYTGINAPYALDTVVTVNVPAGITSPTPVCFPFVT